jgi:hypothetical protein
MAMPFAAILAAAYVRRGPALDERLVRHRGRLKAVRDNAAALLAPAAAGMGELGRPSDLPLR